MVRSMLGAPYVCGLSRPEPLDACQTNGEWVYHTRRNDRGAALRLRFDDMGHVTNAAWHR